MTDKKEIMDRILVGKDESLGDMAKALDFLIYRSEADSDHQDKGTTTETFTISKGNVSVSVWDGKARITVRVPPGRGRDISLKKIASIAVDAINEALAKEQL